MNSVTPKAARGMFGSTSKSALQRGETKAMLAWRIHLDRILRRGYDRRAQLQCARGKPQPPRFRGLHCGADRNTVPQKRKNQCDEYGINDRMLIHRKEKRRKGKLLGNALQWNRIPPATPSRTALPQSHFGGLALGFINAHFLLAKFPWRALHYTHR